MDLVTTLLNCLPPVVSVTALIVVGKLVLKGVDKKLDSVNQTNRKVNFLCEMIKKDHEEKEELRKEMKELTLQMKGFKRNEEKVRKN